MTTTINRRTAMLGTVTLPAALAPLGLAQAASTANATDAAWAELQAAQSAYEANKAAHDAWEAENVPERLHWANSPNACDFADGDDWWARHEAWRQERRAYRNPHDMDDDQLDAFIDRIDGAADAVIETPAATLMDLERKLMVAETGIRGNGDEEANAALVGEIIADVRRLDGRAS